VRGVFARVNALISAIDGAKQELYPNSIRAIDFARPERLLGAARLAPAGPPLRAFARGKCRDPRPSRPERPAPMTASRYGPFRPQAAEGKPAVIDSQNAVV